MKYANLLSNAVAESGWTYSQIIQKCKSKGVSFSRSYLSKIATGVLPPPSDEINKALSEVLSPVSSISYTDLALAKYKEIIPSDVLEAIVAQ
ncbi:hypothetical protein J25TS5_04610 [Paenibacillus faecis]|uniref:hypothetical protein n=1 Tax=Paenibacillus faecis TaxID=862114 RepID=UPI001B1590B2|nr:hypothetical protein [Paenibacillus faecis]GIO83529.1 hypothetical protein J25TS5_04610 [Paenibacillus faecis]